jgi:hypothetical protein
MAAGETLVFAVAVTWDKDTLGTAKSGDGLQAVEWCAPDRRTASPNIASRMSPSFVGSSSTRARRDSL